MLRNEAKGDTPENIAMGQQELARCRDMGIEYGRKLEMNDLVSTDQVIFSATGISRVICCRALAVRATLRLRKPCWFVASPAPSVVSSPFTTWIAKIRTWLSTSCNLQNHPFPSILAC